MKNNPLLVIVGGTASGKTDLSILLAKRFNGEIISADSVSLRKELNIGSSKPKITERQGIPHYLIDEIEPDKKFNASKYKDKAEKVIRDINNNKKLPILVGGSGLYLNSIIYNYQFSDNSIKYSRSYLNSLNNQELIGIAAQNKLLDFKDIDYKNNRRLIRLIESNGQIRHKSKRKRKNTLVIGLYNSPQENLKRIQKRVGEMIEEGLEEEVRGLYLKYGVNSEIFKVIGYKEWLSYFENKATLNDVIEQIIKNTVYLSKKQKTWFKKNNSIHWFNYPLELLGIVELVTSFISK